MVDALQFIEAHGEVYPADWNKGPSGMKADSADVTNYLVKPAKDL